MTRNLLQIAQDAIGQTISAQVPTITQQGSAIGPQLTALLHETARDLIRRHDWDDLKTPATFITVSGDDQGLITDSWPDFDHIVKSSMFDVSLKRQVKGPLTTQQWQAMKSTIVAPVLPMFRIRRKHIYLLNNTYVGHTVSFEYVSNQWLTDSAGSNPHDLIKSDGDLPLLPEDLLVLGLKWRFRQENGFEYGEAFRAYEDALKKWVSNERGQETLSLQPGSDNSFDYPYDIVINV